jgi:hypothetical protein
MGFFLNILASIIKWILQPVGYIYGAIFSLINGEFQEYNLNIAKIKDIFGNVLCKYLFNQVLIVKSGYSFGSFETISYVLGVNRHYGKLTKIGSYIVWFVEKRDPGHFEKAIKNKQ